MAIDDVYSGDIPALVFDADDPENAIAWNHPGVAYVPCKGETGILIDGVFVPVDPNQYSGSLASSHQVVGASDLLINTRQLTPIRWPDANLYGIPYAPQLPKILLQPYWYRIGCLDTPLPEDTSAPDLADPNYIPNPGCTCMSPSALYFSAAYDTAGTYTKMEDWPEPIPFNHTWPWYATATWTKTGAAAGTLSITSASGKDIWMDNGSGVYSVAYSGPYSITSTTQKKFRLKQPVDVPGWPLAPTPYDITITFSGGVAPDSFSITFPFFQWDGDEGDGSLPWAETTKFNGVSYRTSDYGATAPSPPIRTDSTAYGTRHDGRYIPLASSATCSGRSHSTCVYRYGWRRQSASQNLYTKIGKVTAEWDATAEELTLSCGSDSSPAIWYRESGDFFWTEYSSAIAVSDTITYEFYAANDNRYHPMPSDVQTVTVTYTSGTPEGDFTTSYWSECGSSFNYGQVFFSWDSATEEFTIQVPDLDDTNYSGYPKYSINGGSYVGYTGPVSLSATSDIRIQAPTGTTPANTFTVTYDGTTPPDSFTATYTFTRDVINDGAQKEVVAKTLRRPQWYASVAGGGTGLTPSSPATLDYIFTNSSRGDSVWLAAGTYTPSTYSYLAGQGNWYGGFNSTFTERDRDTYETILQGPVFNESPFSSSQKWTVDGCTIQPQWQTVTNPPGVSGSFNTLDHLSASFWFCKLEIPTTPDPASTSTAKYYLRYLGIWFYIREDPNIDITIATNDAEKIIYFGSVSSGVDFVGFNYCDQVTINLDCQDASDYNTILCSVHGSNSTVDITTSEGNPTNTNNSTFLLSFEDCIVNLDMTRGDTGNGIYYWSFNNCLFIRSTVNITSSSGDNVADQVEVAQSMLFYWCLFDVTMTFGSGGYTTSLQEYQHTQVTSVCSEGTMSITTDAAAGHFIRGTTDDIFLTEDAQNEIVFTESLPSPFSTYAGTNTSGNVTRPDAYPCESGNQGTANGYFGGDGNKEDSTGYWGGDGGNGVPLDYTSTFAVAGSGYAGTVPGANGTQYGRYWE